MENLRLSRKKTTMFDIGFFELMMIGIVGLIVLGPERLPHAIRMTGATLGKIRRSALDVKITLEKEMDAIDIKKNMEAQLLAQTNTVSKESTIPSSTSTNETPPETPPPDTDSTATPEPTSESPNSATENPSSSSNSSL